MDDNLQPHHSPLRFLASSERLLSSHAQPLGTSGRQQPRGVSTPQPEPHASELVSIRYEAYREACDDPHDGETERDVMTLEFGFSVLEVNLNQPTILELMSFFTVPDAAAAPGPAAAAGPGPSARGVPAGASAVTLTPTRSAGTGALVARASLSTMFSPVSEGEPMKPEAVSAFYLPPASAPVVAPAPGMDVRGGFDSFDAGAGGVFDAVDGDFMPTAGEEYTATPAPAARSAPANTPERPSRFLFTATMDSLVVCLHDAGSYIARVALQNSEVTVETVGAGMEVVGKLGNLCIKDVWSKEDERAAAADPEAASGSREVFGLRNSEAGSLVNFEMTMEPNRLLRRRSTRARGRNSGPPVEQVWTLFVQMQSVKCVIGAPFVTRLLQFFTETPLFKVEPDTSSSTCGCAVIACADRC